MDINNMNKQMIVLLLLSLPTAAPKGSHSLWLLATYIKGQTQFPQFSYVLMLDDVKLLYYNGETKTVSRIGNTTNEDNVVDLKELIALSDNIEKSFLIKWAVATETQNNTEGPFAYQRLVLCELKDNGEGGQMITRDAFQGFTDELRYLDRNFTYHGTLNITAQVLKWQLDISMWRHENMYYPVCMKTLKSYLEKRRNQVNRKVKPKVRLLQKDLSWVTCLATGFYPRHINLTLFRDGQPVSDDEINGGDLLRNDDGTYQMRKILKISEEEQREKHKYTCTATHLSLDNKLDVTLEYDHGTPFKPVLSTVPTVLAVIVTVAAVIIWRKRHTASSKSEYSSASTSEKHVYKE
ncbi:zinc-alpha-2-glycoprotein [Misgurnus anguillicaudatus]|uniref:zinc-alpha-2-glycoprotein n=1 Tax=Misgurnus anguillicaudatus TaxID=75329 RepID=UPI003CCFC185